VRNLISIAFFFSTVSIQLNHLHFLAFEEECIRTPFHLKSWMFYLDHKAESALPSRFFIYERALQSLPGSFKLWKQYLHLRLSSLLEGPFTEIDNLLDTHQKKNGKPLTAMTPLPTYKRLKPLTDPSWTSLNSCFERCLVLCNKYPTIWLLYLTALQHQPQNLTLTRRTYDKALRSLPLTQHALLWPSYLSFAANSLPSESALRVWRRYVRFTGNSAAEDYLDLLLHGLDPPRVAEAARVLTALLDDPSFFSKHGKTPFNLWSEFCEIVCEHPEELDVPTSNAVFGASSSSGSSASSGRGGVVEVLDVEAILRSGITRFADQVGKIWNALARYWIAKGEFERARDVYEEGIGAVKTVRDFTMVFDAYAEFEESVISARMEALAEDEGAEDGEGMDEEEKKEVELDLDLRLARLVSLIAFVMNPIVYTVF
jgi:pre-mRNA-splicing factor SYF1